MLSFSTCWNSARHTTGQSMLTEIADLGFRNVELGHGIRISLVEGIQQLRDRGNIRVTSLHNFCPLPIEVTTASPNCYEYTSHRKADRDRALKLTLRTLDFAERVGAPLVVLHLGRVPMRDRTRQLTEMAENRAYLTRPYVRAKLAAVHEREKRAPLYLGRAREHLLKIVEAAASKNIHLGVECREAYEEIPTERELPALLDEINSPYVGYWHDIGHAQVKENLGFLDHAAWLARMRHRLIGAHLHDVVWPASDHHAPFLGGIDWDRLLPLFPPDCLFVWEISPRRSREEILAARAAWEKRVGPLSTAA